MIGTILLLIFPAGLYLWLKKIYSRKIAEEKRKVQLLQQERGTLVADQNFLRQDVERSKSVLNDTLALYEVTREISRSLETDKVFAAFGERVSRHLKVQQCCQFLKADADLSLYAGCTVLALTVSRKTEGYLVADVAQKDQERFLVMAHQFFLAMRRAMLYQKVQEMATIDALTQTFTRRFLFERAQEELARSIKFGYPLACLMIDIDRFKEINDHYGHLVGDSILSAVARCVKENIRQIDFIGKYGGEEFGVFLSETSEEGALFVAERIRKAIESKAVKAYDEQLQVTISIGIAVLPQSGKELSVLIDNADKALYKAKETGRNKVCVFGER